MSVAEAGGQGGHIIGLLARAWEILVERAREGQTITYGELATAMLLSPQSAQFTDTLNELSRSENAAGRGLLSVLVIRQREGTPGVGFFRLAQELGRQFDDEEQFFREEVERVTAHWQERPEQPTDTETSSDEAEPSDDSQEESDYEPMDLGGDEEDDGLSEAEKASSLNRIMHGVAEAAGSVKDGATQVSGRLMLQGRRFWKVAKVPQRSRQAGRSISGFIARRRRRGSDNS
jgi:hypothetical protein